MPMAPMPQQSSSSNMPTTNSSTLGSLPLVLSGSTIPPAPHLGKTGLSTRPSARTIRDRSKPASIPQSLVQPGLAELVEAVAHQSPNSAALVVGNETWSYLYLNRLANRLARVLVEQGVQSQRVAVCVDRNSPYWGVGILAIFKAGGAYVPLATNGPRARQSTILHDAQPRLILTTTAHEKGIAALAVEVPLLNLDQISKALEKQADSNLNLPADPERMAYVIYTSGSTGTPKGVAMPQGPLVNLIDWQLREWGKAQAARTLQFAATTFDVAFQELLTTWAAGGTLFPVSDNVRTDPLALLRHLCDFGIERAYLPVAALHYLASAIERTGLLPTSLREIITAGEQLEITPAVRRMHERMPELSIRNHYGPTETHVVTEHVLLPGAAWPQFPPIGKAIANVRTYVLDSDGKPVVAEQPGELYLAGAALADGYWNCPRLTSERFVQVPGIDEPRLYRTGDIVKADADGVLHFLGRVDHQIQIRGHRVEPGEICSVLQQHPQVAQALVLAEADQDHRPQLFAYIQPTDNAQASQLRTELRELVKRELPDYMWPTDLCLIESFPLCAHGKVDRAALTAHRLKDCQKSVANDKPLEARDPVEWRLLGLWEDVLRKPVGLNDDFFDLGGNSLTAMELVMRVEQELGQHASPAQLLQSGSVATMAAALRSVVSPEDWSPLVPLQTQGTRAPLFLIHPGGGNVLCYLELARLLGNEQPVYALQAPGVDGVLDYECSVDYLADVYIQSIKQVQPHGPYAVAGWSFGGIVAFEIAHQLKRQQDEIDFLGVLDAGRLYSLGVLTTLFPEGFDRLLEVMRSDPLQQMREFRERTDVAQLIPPTANDVQARRIYDVFCANSRAFLDYRPAFYEDAIWLFRAEEKFVRGRRDPYRDWNALAAKIHSITVPGNHLTMIHSPHVQHLAAKLSALLTSRGNCRS